MPAPILVFDSGVGGLSIVEAIRRERPDLPLAFACDNQGFPYGPKSEAELLERVEHVIAAAIKQINPSLIVIACNTASTVALPMLREKFSVPFVGVVPAIKPAAQISQNKVIGLLATPGTIKRPYTAQLINDFASDCQVIKVGSTDLVYAAEAKLRGQHLSLDSIKEVLKPFTESAATFTESAATLPDTIVLACTHFPLIKKELQLAMNRDINWVDSGDAIARRVSNILPSLAPIEKNVSEETAYLTAADDALSHLKPAFALRGFNRVDVIKVE